MTVKNKTHQLTLMAMFAALAYILMLVGRIPISSVDFLKYDPKDVILAISGFILGPLPALSIITVVGLIEMITVSSTGFIGLVMNILSSAAFVCTSAAIYKRKHSLRAAVIGLVAGVLLTTGIMLLWNYFVTPIYMGYPRQAVAAMLLPVFLPFNLIKGSINAAITLLVYKPVSRTLKRANLVSSRPDAQPPEKKRSTGVMLIAGLVLISCILAVLVIRGVI